MNLTLALLFILISSIIGSFSTLFFKLGAGKPINLNNSNLGWAVLLASFSFLFYIYALKQAPLMFIYLTASVSYVWAILIAKIFLKEKINKYKVIGLILLLIGIVFLQI